MCTCTLSHINAHMPTQIHTNTLKHAQIQSQLIHTFRDTNVCIQVCIHPQMCMHSRIHRHTQHTNSWVVMHTNVYT